MNKQEFLDQLRVALAGQLPNYTVDEHIRYYQDYIEMEIRMNKDESQVLSELGSPRLLAKSIIDASKREGRSEASEFVEGDDRHTDEQKAGIFPKWILPVIILIGVVLLVSTLFIAALPYLIVGFLIVQVVRFLRSL